MNVFIDPKQCNDLSKTTTLTESAKSDSGEGFRLVHGDEVVFRLDAMCSVIENVWSVSGKRGGKKFKTVDAFVSGSDARNYYIEFKRQPIGNIEISDIKGKAVESLFCTSLTVLNEVPMSEICKKAVFVLVFKPKNPTSAPTGPAGRRLIGMVGKCAKRVCDESSRESNEICFGLKKLKTYGLYADVFTVTEEEFNKMSGVIFGSASNR